MSIGLADSGVEGAAVDAALSQVEAGVDMLRRAGFDALTNTGRIEVLERLECVARTAPALGRTLINQLGEQGAAGEYAVRSLRELLVTRLSITGPDASGRIAAARQLGATHTPTGQAVAPELAATAAAQFDGVIGTDHAHMIRRFLAHLPAAVGDDERAEAGHALAALARQATATEVQARRDTRSQGKRQHDALKVGLRALLASGDLGRHRGLPVTAIFTLDLKELQRGAGAAVTGGGTLLPMRDALRMAAHAHHYLVVFDKHTGRPLYLGRAKRLASADQRIVLHARDIGCTYPGCDAPAYHCQTHHLDEWANGGRTDVDRLTLACGTHHPLVGNDENQWATTTTRPGRSCAGRTRRHPPARLDPARAGRINHHHHPLEHLTSAGDGREGGDDEPRKPHCD
ncbi:DUF222 domain-containing protein [Rhodococcus sp. D2-41]|uniref:HNH endonuclease n=1 Tax=Speluncibacter jeojiensis TaxID=2710754 RepID=A0A9X4LZ07_9ACTN|nr:HNH endonuclease signature motif containing protein [Rhodococcus sp. D2-41]MDG3010469.1 DUF222 domain-containing protein [Rhodococcus sp. D2-41]MDG3014216.1 HNH endonuclease [Corynebacteriales bacterium D3-21]